MKLSDLKPGALVKVVAPNSRTKLFYTSPKGGHSAEAIYYDWFDLYYLNEAEANNLSGATLLCIIEGSFPAQSDCRIIRYFSFLHGETVFHMYQEGPHDVLANLSLLSS